MEFTEQLGGLIMAAKLSQPWWFFILLGVAAGFISGLLGVGSGVIVVPALVLFCAMAQKSAQGAALSLMVPMALLGAYRYWRNPAIEVNYQIVGLLICGAMVGVLVGTAVVSRLPAPVLRRIFACFLAIVAIRMFLASSKPRPAVDGTGSPNTMQPSDGNGGTPDDANP